MTYKSFSSAMRTSSRPYSQRRSESFTDRDWEKKKDEYERRDLMPYRAGEHAPWPVLDTPGCEVQPWVSAALMAPSCITRRHWTADEYDASSAWICSFRNGGQDYDHKSYECSAVAVRCIPLVS